MLKVSGARLCWAVLLTVLTTATRAIPRVLTEASGVSNSATAVFVLRGASLKTAPRQSICSTNVLICPNPNRLDLFPGFSGMLQQEIGKNRLRLLEEQRE